MLNTLPLELAQRRILIVEDEAMISALLDVLLRSYGYHVIGPVSSVHSAVQLAASEPLDGAILDLNVAGEEVYPVAEVLTARGIPFLFMTGYKSRAINEKYRQRVRLEKPFKAKTLKHSLQRMLAL